MVDYEQIRKVLQELRGHLRRRHLELHRVDLGALGKLENDRAKGHDRIMKAIAREARREGAETAQAAPPVEPGVLHLTTSLRTPSAPTAWSQVKRWRFATPVSRVSVESANPEGSRIALCGDAVADALGLDAVLMSGRRAASVLTSA